MKNQDFTNKKVVQPIEFEDKSIPVGRFDAQKTLKQEEQQNLFKGLIGSKEMVLQNPEMEVVDVRTGLPQLPYLYQPIPLAEQIRMGAPITETQEYVFDSEVARSYAKVVDYINREKVKENTLHSNYITEQGVLRGTQFVDGSQCYHKIADSRLLDGRKWRINGNLFVKLKVQNIKDYSVQWTPVMDIEALQDVKFIENLISRYFAPAESRAYLKETLKDIKSRIFEYLNMLPESCLDVKAGWKSLEHYVYVDGEDYPVQNIPLAILRKPRCNDVADINCVLKTICEELTTNDFQNRICALIVYGMTAWLSTLFVKQKVRQPELLLTGEPAICHAYANACLKMYSREAGDDILILTEVNEDWLSGYVKVLRDDVMVVSCFETGRRMKLLKLITSSGAVSDCKLEVPFAILQTFPSKEVIYTDFISVDLYGLKTSQKLENNLKILKNILLKAIERKTIVEFPIYEGVVSSFRQETDIVMTVLKNLLYEAGGEKDLIGQLIEKLKFGSSFLNTHQLCNQDIFVNVFIQRFQTLIDQRKIRLTDNYHSALEAEEESVWMTNGRLYIPSKLFNHRILPLMNIQQKEFKCIREMLIAQGILAIYNSESEFTKRITLPSGDRVHVYDFNKCILIA